jgi:hypothetical protein
MSKRPLLPVLLTGLLTLVGLNFAIAAWSHRLPYYRDLEEIRTAHDPNLLVVGNSLLDNRVDEAAFAQAANGHTFRLLNTALGASEPPEHLLLFDYAVQNHPGIRTLVLGVYDFQLTVPDRSRLTGLTGNRMVGIDPRFPVSEVAAVYGFGPVERLELEAIRSLPLLANRASAWKYVELLRRSMAAMGMPGEATNSMGRVNDFAALEAASTGLFDAQASAFLQHPGQFNASYEEIFRQARSAGMNVVIVVMPMSPSHRQTFYARPLWRQYLAAVEDVAARRGIRVIDASDWLLQPLDFADHLHMTREASGAFSFRLGGELARSWPASRP